MWVDSRGTSGVAVRDLRCGQGEFSHHCNSVYNVVFLYSWLTHVPYMQIMYYKPLFKLLVDDYDLFPASSAATDHRDLVAVGGGEGHMFTIVN